MEMVKAEIRIPLGLYKYLETENSASELERNALLIYPFIRNHTISHGKAAEILGINKWRLIELYAGIGIPYLDQSAEEIDAEIENYYRAKEDRHS